MTALPTANDAPRIFRFAAACYKEGDLANAETAAALASALQPRLAEAWVLLGLCRFKGNEHDAAIVAFGKALQLRPDDVQCWVDLAECCLGVGRYEQAAAALRQAMLLDPNAAQAAGRRARVVAAKTMQRLKKGTS